MKPKACSLIKSIKLKASCQKYQEKRKKIGITNIRNERGNITIDFTHIKKKIMKYYKQLHINQFNN